MKYSFIGVLVGVFFFATGLFAHAQIMSSTDIQIAQLAAQVQALQLQYYQLTGILIPITLPNSNQTIQTSSCVSITESFGLGKESAEVTTLQRALADLGFYSGPITGYFGLLTERAVQSFQYTYGIVSSGTSETTGYGFFGTRTKAALYEKTCRRSSVPISVPPITTPPITVPPVVTPVPVTYQSCTLGGISMAHGTSRTFYSQSSAAYNTQTCGQFAQTRTCNNGVLSGSTIYTYAGCVQDSPSSCTLDTVTISHGASRTFYSKLFAAGTTGCDASSLSRTCTNGSLSGSSSYQYAACTTIPAGACRVGATTVLNGESKDFYSAATPASGQACAGIKQSRTCTNEVLSGSSLYTHATCTDTNPGCVVDSVAVASGASRTFYLQKYVPSTESCASYAVSRTCTNGTLTENAAYKYASCTVMPEKACLVNEQVYTNGQSSTFFSVATAPAGSKCTAYDLVRTCSNGVMSGASTYTHRTCADTAQCVLGSVTLADGQSRTFYNAETVPNGSLCSAAGINRTCTNGLLSGAATYSHTSCRVLPPQ